MSHDEATEIVLSARGTNFDPDVVDAFAKVQNEFSSGAARFADSESIVKAKVARRPEVTS
ncbi:MAG: hypothetical protein EPN19_14955 [Betaproteobacteria bacterium]|nr:MAG: hypothetical protein EPN19_14955 [Betaproteobacteria bacterium]